MKKKFTLLLILGAACYRFSAAQPCSDNSLQQYIISAHETDNDIPVETQKHYVFFNTNCTPKNTLILYLNGTLANPSSTLYFPKLAANNGFHVASLKYPNSISAQVPCRNSPDINCYENFRKEILEGIDYSANVSVDADNCVYNRLLKLLIYLHAQFPSQDWNQYFNGNSIKWDRIVVAGHSQGGGHVAMIAKDHEVKRVLMFASPNDYSDFFQAPALWTSKPHVTQGYLYYSFGNTTDEIVDFVEQLEQWHELGLDDFGDTISVDLNEEPYSYSHQLYTSYDPPGSNGNHNSVVVDASTPLGTGGIPEFEPVWRYMLGLGNKLPGEAGSQQFTLESPSFSYALKIDPLYDIANSFKNHSLVLFDLSGRLIRKIMIKSQTIVETELQLLSPGIYTYFHLENGNKLDGGKLLVSPR